jgi:hypothetical protein
MYVAKVITGLRVFGAGGNFGPVEPESYFVLEGSAYEATEFLGVLSVPPYLMQNLVEWLMPEYSNAYVLLVSLNGRYGFPFARNVIEFPTDGELVVDLGTEDDYGVEGLKRMVRDFKLHMEANPDLAAKIGYVIPPKPIKRRIKFDQPNGFTSPGDIHHDILDAIRSLESATDDALVWLAIAGPDNKQAFFKADYPSVIREIEMRQSKNMEFRSKFFPLDKVSMEEIMARQARARNLMAEFNDRFMTGEYTYDFPRAEAWVRRLDNDKLGELSVHTFYSDAGRMGEWKHFVGVFQSRMPGAERN